jgi:CHAD domain-containing protein
MQDEKHKRGSDGKWIAGLGPSTPLASAARRVLTLRFEVVRDYLGLAVRNPDEDSEYVHQLRVGTRRAGAAVEIFSVCLPMKIYKAARKQLKRLRRAAGEARDWDVFLMTLTEMGQGRQSRRRAGLDFLTGYALAQRSSAQSHLEEAGSDYPFAFDRFLAKTIAAIETGRDRNRPQKLLDLAAPLLSDLLTNLEQAAGADLSDYSRLHRVRIFGKRLRYAMEVFADCFPPTFRTEHYPDVEEMQDILGRANDSYIAGQRLRTLGAKIQAARPKDWRRFRPGIEGHLRFHEQRLPVERKRFLAWWRRWQRSGRRTAFTAMLRGPDAAICTKAIKPVSPPA